LIDAGWDDLATAGGGLTPPTSFVELEQAIQRGKVAAAEVGQLKWLR
jgi:hypothetical protein